MAAPPTSSSSSSPSSPSSPPPSTGPSSAQLLASTHRFLHALSTCTPPLTLLTHFSTTAPISLLHSPYPSSQSSLLHGPTAIRSYFDLLATHWTRSHLRAPPEHIHTNPHLRTVTLARASTRWTWRASGRSWTEEFTCVLAFDDLGKITSIQVRTESDPRTCVMLAVDADATNVFKPAKKRGPGSTGSNPSTRDSGGLPTSPAVWMQATDLNSY